MTIPPLPAGLLDQVRNAHLGAVAAAWTAGVEEGVRMERARTVLANGNELAVAGLAAAPHSPEGT